MNCIIQPAAWCAVYFLFYFHMIIVQCYVDLQARMKAIGVKITVVTSAAFDVGLLGLKKKQQKDEQMCSLVVFCQ